MKNDRTFTKETIFFILLFIANTAFSQTGVITGTVIDSYDKASLPGASVYIKAISKGASTDLNGKFVLPGVPLGENTLQISYVGYKTIDIDIDVNAELGNDLGTIELELEAAMLGEEIVVTAQILGQQRAINQQLNSDAIANVVSADKIQELPDVNAAEAIARLPGIAINRSGGEGQKVVIRGMEPKFAAITINGVRLPSNDGTDRSVDLSLISPELLDGIEVFKSPLPNMDAESIGGTVNLKLRKAPDNFRLLAKALGGFNQLNSTYNDYKGVLQLSNRLLNDKLGFVAQGSIERRNRSGDFIGYTWARGRTDPETGITDIEGTSLTLEDRQEIRKRINGSLNLDYELGKGHSLSLFGLYSRTTRDRFLMRNLYNPSTPAIEYRGRGIENGLNLYSASFSGVNPIGKFLVDWSLSSSQSQGETPYDFEMRFQTVPTNLFDSELDREGNPINYLAAANPNLDETFLDRNALRNSETLERTNTAIINVKLPFKLGEKISGEIKAGGKYFNVNRERDVNLFEERFYYLGGEFTETANQTAGGNLGFIASNGQLISIDNFLLQENDIQLDLESGEEFNFIGSLDQDKIRDWSELQRNNFKNSRYPLVDNYDLEESILAGYLMVKLNIGNNLTIIPGVRYEDSDNNYSSSISFATGPYGQIGNINDTTTFQKYGELFPHLHIKYKPKDWFDVRASYSKTIARPDYNFLTPRAQINQSSLDIEAGNPVLRPSLSTNYDLFFTFFKQGIGLLTIGGFRKDIVDTFIPRSIILSTPEIAAANNWEGFSGYNLDSYTNLQESEVYGIEIDIQSNLALLPMPFSGFVFNFNYAKLFSTTEVFFLTSETTFGGGFPPVPIITFTENVRNVAMPSQAPDIFRMSIGYDYKSFSARVSGSFQGTKARSYSLNKDFDSSDLEFWRWDASAKQRFGKNWSIFLNLENITNQQDIGFIRNQDFINSIETYGFTGTMGVQYKL